MSILGRRQGLANRLLAALPVSERRSLDADLEHVELELRQSLYEPGAPISHVYFLTDGVASLVSPLEGGEIVEVATIGDEGVVGLPVFLGADSVPLRAFCQVPGAAYRLPAEAFREASRNGKALQRLLLLYTQALFTQIAQCVACNRAHGIAQRCARWFLMTHDRMHRDQFLLTQQFLAQMLGTRRQNVTEAAGALQAAGVITYRRGLISILDRKGLEAAACECYGTIQTEYDRLLGGWTPS